MSMRERGRISACTRRYIGYLRQQQNGGSSVVDARWNVNGESHTVTISKTSDARKGWIPRGDWLRSVFLPVGYPESVSSQSYLTYVMWQGVHHACSAANGALASAFLLYSAGLGSAAAIPTAGALNWILKDGLGQGATLMVTKMVSRNFDSSTRLWYVLAALQLDVAIGMEIMTYSLPQYLFVPVAAAANGMKGLAWMTGGATRTAFHVSFARMGNIGDITAKATSQTICASLLGTWGGLAMAAMVHQDVLWAGLVYSCLSGLHVFSSYKSAMIVPLKSLDAARLKRIAQCVVHGEGMPSPEDVEDALYVSHRDDQCPDYTVSVEYIARQYSSFLVDCGWLFRDTKYIVIPRGANQRPLVLLHEECRIHDFIEAGICVVHLSQKKNVYTGGEVLAEEIQDSMDWARSKTDETVLELERLGWDTSSVMETYMASAAEWR